MFWLRNKKNNFPLRTLIWGPATAKITTRYGPGDKTWEDSIQPDQLQSWNLVRTLVDSAYQNINFPSNNSKQLIFNINAVVLALIICYYEKGKMYTWILVFLLCSWKIETYF